MLPTEPQLNCCLDFTVRRVVMSSEMFFFTWPLWRSWRLWKRWKSDGDNGLL